MKFIKHTEGILSVQEVLRSGRTSREFAVQLNTKGLTYFYKIYPTVEEAKKEMENLYKKLSIYKDMIDKINFIYGFIKGLGDGLEKYNASR